MVIFLLFLMDQSKSVKMQNDEATPRKNIQYIVIGVCLVRLNKQSKDNKKLEPKFLT